MNLDQLLDRDDLFFTEFPDGRSFIWRLLTLKEYRRFVQLRATNQWHLHYLHMKVFERCYQGEFGLISRNAYLGIPVSIGNLIMYLSGDCEVETVKEEIAIARSMYVSVDLMETLKRIILLAYPNYKPSELNDLNRTSLIKLFVEAEAMLKAKAGDAYKPLDLNNIVSASAVSKSTDTGIENINFDVENSQIEGATHPWDAVDIMEKEYAEKQAAIKLSKEQAQKIDRLQQRRR